MSENVDLVQLVNEFTELKKVGREWHGPCPKCGGRDRFVVSPDKGLCFCRHHQECGFSGGDAIEFYAWVEGLDRLEAARRLLDRADLASGVTVTPRNQASQREEGTADQDPDWTRNAQSFVRRSVDRLHGAEGEAGRSYFARRGISPSTYDRFGVGFAMVELGDNEPRPVIVLPIRDPWKHSRLVGVKYRLIDARGVTDRLRYRKGSRPGIFAPLESTGDYSVAITEGEFNAMSIAEVVPSIDVFSVGDKASIAPIPSLTEGKLFAVLWFDEKPSVQAALECICCVEAATVSSEDGMDANDVLVSRGGEALLHTIRQGTLHRIERMPFPSQFPKRS